jgi:two-component system response regulator VicR
MATSLSVGQLTSRLGALQGPPENRDETHSDIIATGDFRIDNQSRTLTVRGRELILTSEEFDLLVFLVGHPRRVVTSRTLLSTRCGAHEVLQTQFLRVLTTLREKLEAVAGREGYIRTEPWIVYRFEPGL